MNSTAPGKLLSIAGAAAAVSARRSGRSASEALPAPARLAGDHEAAGRDEAPGAFHAAIDEGGAADEIGDEFFRRTLVEILLRPDLANPALAHDDEAVGHGQGLLLVVGHHHGGQSELALQFADLDAHLLAQLGVEIGQRLVEQQHVGPEHQRTGQRHALLLAAGQLPRQPVAEMIEPHQAQGLGDLRRHLGLRYLAHLEAEGDVLGHRHVRKQRVALEHEAGVALPGRQAGDVAFAEMHAPAVGSTKPATMRRVVVLPQPEGPSRTRNSPSATSSDTSSAALKSP